MAFLWHGRLARLGTRVTRPAVRRMHTESSDEKQINDLERSVWTVNRRGPALGCVREHFRVFHSERLAVAQPQ